MLTNPFFWTGQLGLLLGVLGCAVLLHRFRDKGWIEILPIWFGLLMALAMMVRPAIYNIDHTIPAMPYLYRLAMGLLVISRVYVWRKLSLPAQVRIMDKILGYVSLAGILFLLYLGFKIRGK